MKKAWVCYLIALLGSLIFLAAYQGWIAWAVLQTVIWLPGFSLAVSLPAMLLCRVSSRCPSVGEIDQEIVVAFCVSNGLPMPKIKLRMTVENLLTGERFLLKNKEQFPTQNCGGYRCQLKQCRVYDYLGLFCIRPLGGGETTVLIRPRAVEREIPATLLKFQGAWRPKTGGGFGENHELRLYQPGDSLNQIHWKLTAKTGKLMLRQAMEPRQGGAVLSLVLRGSGRELNEKLGELLFLGQYLLHRHASFLLVVWTGQGKQCYTVYDRDSLIQQVDRLLTMPPAEEEISPKELESGMSFHIGGPANEA